MAPRLISKTAAGERVEIIEEIDATFVRVRPLDANDHPVLDPDSVPRILPGSGKLFMRTGIIRRTLLTPEP
jgi:hypothetical protein